MKKQKEVINSKEKVATESTVYVGFSEKELEDFRRISTAYPLSYFEKKRKSVKKSK